MMRFSSVSSGVLGFWGVFWCASGLSLASSSPAPGPFAAMTGLSGQAIAGFLAANGLEPLRAQPVLVALGIAAIALGLSFIVSMIARNDGEEMSVAARACCGAALLVLVITAVGAPGNLAALVFDVMLLLGIGATAVLVSMDHHRNMPLSLLDDQHFETVLRERLANDAALQQYQELCKTSSQTSVEFGSVRPTPSATPRASASRSSTAPV